MKGVILAAGKGSRLYPVTHHIPKPLLPLANRPTLEYAFDQLKECGITEVAIVVGDNEAAMRSALGDGSSVGLQLCYVRQPEPKGLAHAVSFAQTFVGDDSFILYLGDAIYDQPLAPFVQQFKQSGCANLNLVKPVDDPRRFGVATVEGDRIVRLVEKPAEPESNLAMAGMYVFGPAIWSVIPDLQPSGRGEYEITDAIQMMIDRGYDVRAGVYQGHWFDTGTRESFLETSRHLIGDRNVIGDHSSVVGELGEGVVIGDHCQVEVQYIADSVIFPGSVIKAGEIRGSVLGGTMSGENFVNVVRWNDELA